MCPRKLKDVETGLRSETPPQPYAARFEEGTAFQWFMCNGILMVGFIIALSHGELDRVLGLGTLGSYTAS